MEQHLETIVEAFKSLEHKTETNNDSNEKQDPSLVECTLNDQSNGTFNESEESDESLEEKYDIQCCKSMNRIAHILSYYVRWIHHQQSLNEIYEETEQNDADIHMFDVINSGKYLGSYNNTQLLNDFHHIVACHQYATMQQLLVFVDGCYIEHDLCQLLARNYRKRNNHSTPHEEYRCNLYFGYATSTEVATQQILDSIHCFVYHSYDLGHILSASQLYLLNHHEREYKHQLITENIIYSKTPNPPIDRTRPARQSILYNQKIDHHFSDLDHTPDSGTESQDSEDSLSHTPNPQDSCRPVPNTRKLSFVAPIVAVNTPTRGPKYDKNKHDEELMKRIKLSNSKMVIIRQIMNENDNRFLYAMMAQNQGKSNKYVHVLSSYKHLLFEFEPDSISSRPAVDENKSTQSSSTLPLNSSSTEHSKAPNDSAPKTKKKSKKGKHGKALSISLGKFRRHKSETGDSLFKNSKFLKRMNSKKGAKSHRTILSMNMLTIPPNVDELPQPDETAKHKYIKDAIHDTTNAGLSFDYGQRYYYWDYYKDNEDTDALWNGNMRYKYWYIEARETSLKMEMMHLSQYNPKQCTKKTTKENKSKSSLLGKVSQRKVKINNDEGPQDTIYCGMSMEQWNDIEERSHHIHRTVKCKTIRCDSAMWCNEYEIKEEDSIKKEHIIAVLIFCIFDRIRNEFLLSFNQYYNTSLLVELEPKKKKKKKHLLQYNQRGIEWMKRNHGYFANLARLLRESVECFGQRLNRTQEKTFYFGVNDALGLFKKISCHFKLPLLCSSKMNVVLNYMSFNEIHDGLLIEMKYYQPFIRYFDCSFITEFMGENEVIFNGGISMLKIETIYNISEDGDGDGTSTNHFYFIHAINILQSMLSGMMRQEPMTQYDEQIIRYLVQNEFTRAMNHDTDSTQNTNGNHVIPQYVSLLFHHFCMNLDAISIDLRRMNDKSFYGYFAIKPLFFTSQNNFLKLDVLCALFPNVPTIRIIGDRVRKTNCIKLDELFFDEVLLILQSNLISATCQLSKIIISHPNEEILTLESAVNLYQSQFETRSCKMDIDTEKRTLVIHRSIMYHRYPHNMQMQMQDIDGTPNQACLIQ